MHIHLLGIGGTFMGGIAQLAKAMGHRVTGSDQAIYPPMSTQLAQAGIEVMEGFESKHLFPEPDLVLIGNAFSRGNPIVEAVLDQNIPYQSAPAWLHDQILQNRWVLTVAGTHGKTTTTALLAWILQYCGFEPGFLIGGVAQNFSESARLGDSSFFVIEGDEYDTAFFDKRSKFVHYHSKTVILNNLEFDHADIFSDLNAIKTQFHHLIRTVPRVGTLVINQEDENLKETITRGAWSNTACFSSKDASAEWFIKSLDASYQTFEVFRKGETCGSVTWSLLGQHNAQNALAAMAAAHTVGILPRDALDAIRHFKGVKRRLECLGIFNGVTLYDDFAHHPTAIAETLLSLKPRAEGARLIALVEARSNSMKLGVHADKLVGALREADQVHFYQPQPFDWSLTEVLQAYAKPFFVHSDTMAVIAGLKAGLRPGDHLVMMSNGPFDGLRDTIPQILSQ